MTPPAVTPDGPWLRDPQGRIVLLKGVNLGGSSKIPYGFDALQAGAPKPHAPVSFVGRPFPAAEADEHLGRLRRWGFNCLRLLTTWEAVEPEAPGRYDERYLDYLRDVVVKAGEHGFRVFIDPHQDVWSRLTGGDGAPTWTLDAVGFDVAKLDASEAAITMAGRHPNYAVMAWPNNWSRLAGATMYTLFFAGEKAAPGCRIGGESAQGFLQRHFIGAMTEVARRVAGLSHVMGFDSLNEPSPGYIGVRDLARPLPVFNSAARVTGFQSLYVPAGFAAEAPYVERRGLKQVESGTTALNPAGVSAWKDPAKDVWRAHGVWDVDAEGAPRLLRPDYFAGLDFYRDGILPFARRLGAALREVDPKALLFLEGEPQAASPPWDGSIPIVNAGHWYDLLTLNTKHYDPERALVWSGSGDEEVHGAENVRRSFAAQIGKHAALSRERLGGVPTMIGEFGLNMDLDGGKAFRDGDFTDQERALASYYDALDANLVHSALWNYTADNTNRWGDHWNGEDLSIFSRDQQKDPADPDSGARGLRGFCRPTVRACAGEPRSQSFDARTRAYVFELDADGGEAPSEFYIPRLQYPDGFRCDVTSGSVGHDPISQILLWRDAAPGRQTLRIEVKTP